MRALNEAIEGADAFAKMMEKVQDGGDGGDSQKRRVVSALAGDYVVQSPAAETRRNETRKQRRLRLREESKRAQRIAKV